MHRIYKLHVNNRTINMLKERRETPLVSSTLNMMQIQIVCKLKYIRLLKKNHTFLFLFLKKKIIISINELNTITNFATKLVRYFKSDKLLRAQLFVRRKK